MKKLFAIILTIAMIASMSVTASADNTTGGSTEVSFNVDSFYTITIPGNVTLGKETANDGTVTYENDYTITAEPGVRLNKNASIEVTLASDFVMATTQGATLPYTITQGTNTITAENNKVATFTTSTSEQTSTIHISANDPEFAGEYKDTVTFTIAVVSAPSAPATISFTINGVTYQAEEGMTWGDWVESAYNVDEFVESDGGIFSYGMVCYDDSDYGGVRTSDVIEAGHDYSKVSF